MKMIVPLRGDRLANKSIRRNLGGYAINILVELVSLRRKLLIENDSKMNESLAQGWVQVGAYTIRSSIRCDVFMTRFKGRLLIRVIIPSRSGNIPAVIMDSDFDTIHEKFLRLNIL